MTVHFAEGLEFEVDRGPNWLIVKLRSAAPIDDLPQIADELWAIASRHFIYRVVLELDNLQCLPRDLMSQLVLLQERLVQCGGALRICGLSPGCEEMLHLWQLDTALPNHATREAAVMGSSDLTLLAH